MSIFSAIVNFKGALLDALFGNALPHRGYESGCNPQGPVFNEPTFGGGHPGRPQPAKPHCPHVGHPHPHPHPRTTEIVATYGRSSGLFRSNY